MPPSNVVVDGSNIATEGRTTPSLDQLDQAVRQYLDEHPGSNVTVVVDASFGHRIEPSERAAFEQAVAHGELVSPPAGAIGRGDAFLLRIAERIAARVLSNDSFREFHAEHPWLFDEGRLVGGTPVPGVGWIFTPRRPVRGPLTPTVAGSGRRSSREGAGKARAGAGDDEFEPDGAGSADGAASGTKQGRGGESSEGPKPKSGRSRGSRRGKAPDRKVQAAIAEATEEALTSGEGKQQKGKPKPKSEAAPDAVNDPLPFITFASEHPVGSELQGTVVSFTSHGAMAQVEDMLCYVPLAGLGDPPPRRARDVLRQGETRTFELVALDPSRRGAQLALPEVVAVHGEIAEGAEEAASEVRGRRKGRASTSGTEVEPTMEPEKAKLPVKRGAPTQPRKRGPQKTKPRSPEPRTQATRARGTKSAERAHEPTPDEVHHSGAEPAKKAKAAKEIVPAKKRAAKKAAPKSPSPVKAADARKVEVSAKRVKKVQKPAKKVQKPARKVKEVKEVAPAKMTSPAKAAPARKAPGTGKVSTARKVPASQKAGAGSSKKAPRAQKSARSKASGTKAVAAKAGVKKATADRRPVKK